MESQAKMAGFVTT